VASWGGKTTGDSHFIRAELKRYTKQSIQKMYTHVQFLTISVATNVSTNFFAVVGWTDLIRKL